LVKSGIAPRKKIRAFIRTGRVVVNGEVIKSPSFKIDPSKDKILVDGKPVVVEFQIYIALYKPKGYVTSAVDQHHPTVFDIIGDTFGSRKLFPAGRLDVDAEGLLILTDDGEFAHRLTHPKYKIPRVYEVEIRPPLDDNAIEIIEKGELTLRSGYKPLPAKIQKIDEGKILMTVFEGKYHIVKRIIAAAGSKVLSLKRVAIGPITLEGLAPGEWRKLESEELEALRKILNL